MAQRSTGRALAGEQDGEATSRHHDSHAGARSTPSASTGPPAAVFSAWSTRPADRWADTASTTYPTVAPMPSPSASHHTGPRGVTVPPSAAVPATTTTAACTGTSPTTQAQRNVTTARGSLRTGASASRARTAAMAVNARNAQITPPSNTVGDPGR